MLSNRSNAAEIITKFFIVCELEIKKSLIFESFVLRKKTLLKYLLYVFTKSLGK